MILQESRRGDFHFVLSRTRNADRLRAETQGPTMVKLLEQTVVTPMSHRPIQPPALDADRGWRLRREPGVADRASCAGRGEADSRHRRVLWIAFSYLVLHETVILPRQGIGYVARRRWLGGGEIAIPVPHLHQSRSDLTVSKARAAIRATPPL
jgi:hypothetical protein